MNFLNFFYTDPAEIERMETLLALPERVQRALETLDEVPDSVRPEISGLLHELLLVMGERDALEEEIGSWIWWGEQQHSGRPRGTTIHRWQNRDFLLLVKRAAIIEATNFWARAEEIEQQHRNRGAEQWVEILQENGVLDDLPPQYRPSALRILPLLRDNSMRQKGEREPHALALWHAQFCLGSPALRPEGKWYQPSSIARMLRKHRREEPWFWKQADEEETATR